MNALVINIHKGQRMDLTAQMKDADAVLEQFSNHDIRFDKKYTTIAGEGPSTITFKGVRSKTTYDKLADMLSDLTISARKGEIGNVYIKFVGPRPKMTSTVSGTSNTKVETIVQENMEEDDTL